MPTDLPLQETPDSAAQEPFSARERTLANSPLADLSAPAFSQWLHHPVTKVYRQFLRDQADNWLQAASDLWLEGNLDDKRSGELRGRTLAFSELCELTFDRMAAFYESEPNEPT